MHQVKMSDTPVEQTMVTAARSLPKHMEEMRDAVEKGDASALASLLETHEVRPYLSLFSSLKFLQ
jgi:hypothetical protein